MALPKITVVTPSYNQAEYLEETIQSVLSQGYPNLEYMIIDGGSTDGSADIIKKYEPHLAYWRSHKDEGQTSAIVEGFQRATGDILAWLNSDDCYEPGVLHKIAKEFQDNPDAVMVFGDYNLLRRNGEKVLKKKVTFDYKVVAHAYLMVPQPSAFWTRKAYEEVGGLDVSLHYTMDYDLFLKFGKAYPKKSFVHIRQPFSAFRLHDESKSVGSADKFGPEWSQVAARFVSATPAWKARVLRYLYLLKLEGMFLTQRGYLPLRKDRTKA